MGNPSEPDLQANHGRRPACTTGQAALLGLGLGTHAGRQLHLRDGRRLVGERPRQRMDAEFFAVHGADHDGAIRRRLAAFRLCRLDPGKVERRRHGCRLSGLKDRDRRNVITRHGGGTPSTTC